MIGAIRRGSRSGFIILAKTRHLVHAFVKHRDDTNSNVREVAPVHVMMLAPCVEAFYTELCRHPAPHALPARYALKACEEAADVGFRLSLSPSFAGIGEYLVESLARGSGNPNS